MRPWRWLWVRFRARRYDATVIVGLWAAVLWMGLTSLRTHRPVVLWEHSLVESRLPNDRRLRRAQRVIWRTFNKADAFVAVSTIAGRYLQNALQERGRPDAEVTVIPNALDPEAHRFVRSGATGGEGRVVELLAAHRLTPLKNTLLTLEALAHLPPEFHLTVLGDGPLRATLERRAIELGVDGRVDFHGFVPDVAPYLRRATAFVHPSLAETFCIAVFEAAQAHVPVACLSVGSLVDSVPNHVPGIRLAEAPTAEAFANAIRDAVAMKPQTKVFEAADQRRAIELAPASIAEQWTRLIDRVTHEV
jgi:glycosyltransferase involved in cell wall biosynthesis